MEVNPFRQSILLRIRAQTEVGNARRQATALSTRLGFSETEAGKVAIVATELATNLVKHAGGGELILRGLDGPTAGIELMSLDKGPGFDAQIALQDGYSTVGSAGTGMGAIERLSESFYTYSLPARGSVQVATLWRTGKGPTPHDCAAVCVPIKGETHCGDAWMIRDTGDGLQIMVCDGLGHGIFAAEASNRALATFAAREGIPANQLLRQLHSALQSTRGAAISVADLGPQSVVYCGVGNIGGHIYTGTRSRGMVSHNGIVGHQAPRISDFTYPLVANDLVVMHSDGLAPHWKIEDYPGLIYRPCSVIAGVFFRDFRRARDDATIVVVRRSAT
ncbi:ATP-binding SpoIIE family protein phosphatase [Asticcacaulis tiandongensis]|uniref:ATP-binding SpoIIE family protein phosphatase n=1 Tax=Asticcacaulis tiandongensis TaxID=2565365 RepID=UPI001129B327|nr:ATP-binding SpoIIE family protein phosphatase [Asticcacaulis tiandongensis]